MTHRALSWAAFLSVLEPWQRVILGAFVGAAVAGLALELASVLGDVLQQQWLKDVGENVNGPTASGGGAAAGAGAAAGGPPGGNRRSPRSDPHGVPGESQEDRANREYEEQQERRRMLDDARKRQAERDARRRDREVSPEDTSREQTLGDVYRRR